MFVYVYVCMFMYICICVFTYIYIFMCVYMYMYFYVNLKGAQVLARLIILGSIVFWEGLLVWCCYP